jgi:hypothetical protein
MYDHAQRLWLSYIASKIINASWQCNAIRRQAALHPYSSGDDAIAKL